MNFIDFNDKLYPDFQGKGFAAKYAFPFANEFCKGVGLDIGCNRYEWALPGSTPIDLAFGDGFDAMNLPDININYIFSSHCLEHIPDWVTVLKYWNTKIHKEGVIFLYLPDYSQEYWRPWNNRKHVNVLTPDIIKDFFINEKYEHVLTSGVDLNNSFYVVAIK